jgi:hypothetical protein
MIPAAPPPAAGRRPDGTPAGTKRSRAITAIVVGGVAAGVLDISSAIGAWLPRGVSPVRILQSVAAGVYGAEARRGGWKTALVGLGLHFLIAFTAAALFYLASRKLRFMTARPVIAGFIYGELVYLFMNFVVVPLSAIGERFPFSWQSLITGPVGHLIFVGLPISLAVSHYAPAHRERARSLSRPSPR